jgi:hypothetical protein
MFFYGDLLHQKVAGRSSPTPIITPTVSMATGGQPSRESFFWLSSFPDRVVALESLESSGKIQKLQCFRAFQLSNGPISGKPGKLRTGIFMQPLR